MRLRVVADMETRIKSVTNRLGLDRAKAKKYIDELEEDRRRWVRTFYNIDWEQSRSYDFLINVEHANVENVASAFCAVAQLPEFRETPAARAAMENLLLASRCRVALAEDDRTYYAGFQVQADRGNVSISYLPRHLKVADSIAAVVEKVPGVRQIFATMAASRILWIQEHFNPTGETFQHVVEVAKKWGAAVELLRLEPAETSSVVEQAPAGQDGITPAATRGTGGIEDDVPTDLQSSRLREEGVEETFNESSCRAADQQRHGETFAFHFLRDVHHFVERRRDEPAQADQMRACFARGFQNLVAGHHHAEVDHFVVVAAQHDADDVFADVVDVALHGGHDDAALARDTPPACFSASR